MCPGNIVAGGGGDAGGGSGGSGKKGKGKAGAGTTDGGEDADGGDKSLGACGNGANGGCPNPSHGGGGQVTAGDPVDLATGRVFTVPAVDLVLGGPFPLILRRTYSTSILQHDVGLGFGWSHTFAWEVEVKRRKIVLWTAAGGRRTFDSIDIGGSVVSDVGQLLRYKWGFLLVSKGGVQRTFLPLGKTGRHLLVEVSEPNGNSIRLSYEKGKLATITDSVGRVVHVRRERTGRIASFDVAVDESGASRHSFRSYRYSDAGDLVSAINADGAATLFSYEKHRMVHVLRPSGLEVHYRYDSTGRCIETWCDYGTAPDPSLDVDMPELLADGFTPAKGVHHVRIDFATDDYVEVADSRQVRRFFTNEHERADKVDWGGAVHDNEFDLRGNLIGSTDAEQNTWKWLYDRHDRLLKSENPAGVKLEFAYHPSGAIESVKGPDKDFVRYHRDPVGNPQFIEDQAGAVVQYQYDERGQVIEATTSNGAVTRFQNDQHGNRVFIVEPDGSTRAIAYDFLGRPVAHRDATGFETQYLYDSCGRVVSTRTSDGTESRTEYDAQGRVHRMVDAEGRVTTLYYGGLDRVVRVERADGTHVDYRYDREGDLVRIINEAGEQHRLVRKSTGYIEREETFDGRTLHYDYDGNGEISALKCGRREVTTTTGPTGQLLAKEYGDGSVVQYEFDQKERLIRAKTGQTEVEYTYDVRGNVTSETVHVAGRKYRIESEFDSAYRRVSSRLDDVMLANATYDLMGRATRVGLPDGEFVTSQFDQAGREAVRQFSRGGRIERRFDASGKQTSLHVVDEALRRNTGAEPKWVGQIPGESWFQSFVYDREGDVTQVNEPDGSVVHEHDILGRLRKTVTKAGTEEQYLHDITGNWYPDRDRQYEPGGRPKRYGAAELVFDDGGYVIEKRVSRADGTIAVTRFEWLDSGALSSVTEPDGVRHEFISDAFGRCLLQQSLKDDVLLSETRFDWDSESLIREHTVQYAEGGPTNVSERSYAYEPTGAMLAERRHSWSELGGARFDEVDSGWLYHESAYDGSPSLLLSARGQVVERADLDPWGRLRSTHKSNTQLRRQGQHQAPAGLYYNRHRFYDPEAGTYLSPEPLGIGESLKAYAYVDNYPHRVVDVDGLKMKATLKRKDGTEVKATSGKKYVSDKDGKREKPLHPAVQAALPPNTARDNPVPASECAEPRALSDHIEDWEKRNRKPPPPKSCSPGDENWRDNLKSAMDEVDEISSSDKDGAAAACPNCSQTIPRLAKLAGTNPPKIGKGRDFSVDGKKREGDHSTSLPTDSFQGNAANRKANTSGLTQKQADAVKDLDLGMY